MSRAACHDRPRPVAVVALSRLAGLTGSCAVAGCARLTGSCAVAGCARLTGSCAVAGCARLTGSCAVAGCARLTGLDSAPPLGHVGAMCRNIRVLHSFDPPTTEEEIRAAALQYVRKVSGFTKPPVGEQSAFDVAVDAVAADTRRLLESLKIREPLRTREGEQLKARERWKQREARLRGD
jgi:hypothetical protein